MNIYLALVVSGLGASIGILIGKGEEVGWAFFNWALWLPYYRCICGCELREHEIRPGDYHCKNWLDCGCRKLWLELVTERHQ